MFEQTQFTIQDNIELTDSELETIAGGHGDDKCHHYPKKDHCYPKPKCHDHYPKPKKHWP
ncbi:hypothetical protein [Scytonema sp. NUACC26]|uniref:hypothetical protein n=1 Tax=Scytonema sp. NUACC26 TaxID=3140176 RepID=UPI0034DCC16C